MRIAFIGQNIFPDSTDGTKKYVEEVSQCMAKMGHSVFVYGSKNNFSKKMLSDKNIKIIFLPAWGETLNIFLASIHAMFENYDVIHYQSQNAFFLSKIIRAVKPQIRIVFSFDLVCDFSNKPRAAAQITKETDEIIKLNLRSKRYALFAGELSKESGAHYLIEAFKLLENSAKTPNNFKLVLLEIGQRDEDYVKYLHTISEGRSNIVLVKQALKKLSDQLFSHAYLFVQASDSLTAPDVLLMKAMSFALTPVVSNIKENTDVIGQAGFSFVSKSVSDLESRLAYLLSRNDEAEKFGKLAKEKIEREYSWETIAQKSMGSHKN